MFNLSADNLYDWHYLFLLISMDRVGVFLADLHFPLSDRIDVVRDVARGFVRAFYTRELDLLVRGQLSQAAADLFAATYDELARRLETEAAARFRDWGNRMQMDRTLEWSLDHLWYDVFVPWAHTSDGPPMAASPAFQGMVKAVVIRCDGALKGLYDALDVVDSIPVDGWDAEAYRYYNQGHRRQVEASRMTASPLGYLEALITYTRLYAALCQIRDLASPDDFEALIAWIDVHFPDQNSIDGAALFESICPPSSPLVT